MNYCKSPWYVALLMFGTTFSVLADTDKQEAYLDIYGHIMLDMGYQSGSNDPNWYDVVRPTKLPVFENQYGPDGNYFASVRQSRFGVKGFKPTTKGDIKTIFEFELFGVGSDEGQTTFRLRHAYGEFNNVGAGQYWSVFMDPDVFPNSLEYWGPNGMVFFRNIQLRYTPIAGKNTVAIALEKPGASGDPGVRVDDPVVPFLEPRFPLPDLTAHYRRTDDWGHFQVAGILRYAEIVDQSNSPVDQSQDIAGWGVNLSTNVKFSADTLKLQLVFGEGIQNYMNDGSVDIGATAPGSSNISEELPLVGVVAFYDRTWNERFTSTIGYSLIDIDNSAGQTASAFRKGQYALANLLYHPVENVMWGVELQWGKRDNKGDGQMDTIDGLSRLVKSSDDLRVQLSFKYNFGTRIGG
ncbi:MAG: DcaP family trimeric outer membrane transporter [Gammaproteobacteria bacterium]